MSDLKVAVRLKSQNAIVWLVEALEEFDHIVASKDDPKTYAIVYTTRSQRFQTGQLDLHPIHPQSSQDLSI